MGALESKNHKKNFALIGYFIASVSALLFAPEYAAAAINQPHCSSAVISGEITNFPAGSHEKLREVASSICECLKTRRIGQDCVGFILPNCKTTYQQCANLETSAWRFLMRVFIDTLEKKDIALERLTVAQTSWERYLKEECSFVYSIWVGKPVMRTTEVARCNLTLTATRALALRSHVMNAE